MGQILSSETVYATAYLTFIGRSYLFYPGLRFSATTNAPGYVDLFQATHFSMSDPDINYNLLPTALFESGDVPDVSGKNETCIKGTLVSKEHNLIIWDVSTTPSPNPSPTPGINTGEMSPVLDYSVSTNSYILAAESDSVSTNSSPCSSSSLNLDKLTKTA